MPTTNFAWDYPTSASTVDVPRDIKTLADDIDTTVGSLHRTGTSAARPAVIVGATFYETDTNRLYIGIRVASVNYWAPMPGTLMCYVRQTVSQPLTHNVGANLTWGVADYDPFGLWASGAPTRITPKVPGWYEFMGVASFSVNPDGSRQASFTKKTVGVAGGSAFTSPAPAGITTVLTRAMPFYCDGTTDYVELAVMQTSGVALSTVISGTSGQSHTTVKYLGP